MLLRTNLIGFGGKTTPYVAQGVKFDGTVDYLTRGADLTGNADSKLWTGSFWFGDFGPGTLRIGESAGARWSIKFLITGALEITAKNATLTEILNIRTATVTFGAGWHHLLFSLNLAQPGSARIFLDDAADLLTATFTDDTIDFTDTNHVIGAGAAGGNKYNGNLAELYLSFGKFLDLTTVSNRRKFITAGLCPVNLGPDGFNPFQAAPIMYFSGAVDDWHTNKGPGGGFTENGALAAATTNPC